MRTIVVIGGGAAGMFAAVHAARSGASVVLVEKNEKLGKKIYITGKGRCNLTNHSTRDELLEAVTGRRSRFLYSAFSRWDAEDTIRFFEDAGLRLKEERGRRMFPVSDHASDVTAALAGQLKTAGVKILLETEAVSLTTGAEGALTGVRVRSCRSGRDQILPANACIIATGGLSYPSTGSTGDGYRFAGETGHTINPLSPSLVPMDTDESWTRELQGLTLKNVGVRFKLGTKTVYAEEIGELLFTHFGISGPAVLSASSVLSGKLYPNGYPADKTGSKMTDAGVQVEIDLKPALTHDELDKRVLRELAAHHRQDFVNAIRGLFPKKLVPVMVRLSGIDPAKKADQISAKERSRFVDLTKHLTFTATALRGWSEAVITHGGVDTGQLDPKTMESKITPGLYFAGEVIDVDALTGGFNLQIAWSTGYAAGTAAAEDS